MRHLFHTPTVGENLVHICKAGAFPCKVVKVSPAVCKVELLAGGVNNSLVGQVVNAHIATLRTV